MSIIEINLPLLLAFALALVHFLGEEIEEYISGYRQRIVSFGAGVSISYIFLQLLPEFHSMAIGRHNPVFLFPLLGFSSLHLVEKYIAKSDVTGDEARKEYGEIHSIFLFLYSLVIGYLLASLVARNTVSGLLFFVAIIIHVAVSSFSLSELHEDFARKLHVKIGLSSAPVIGVLIHASGLVSDVVFTPAFGAVVGMFSYVVIRDSIPRDEKGMPIEYVAGMTLYIVVILVSNIYTA
jgi:hypothetical protein